ncbi:MAG: Gfo/Idh/MocA family protein [Janthinobacterium lividum]
MVRVGVVGMGKMGLSHLAVINAHPGVVVAGICDSAKYVLDVLGKYTGLVGYTDYETMLAEANLDAVLIATPSALHAPMVRTALDRNLHVFCEKPFCLDAGEGAVLAALATEKGRVCQVGYHNRFVASFGEVKRLVDTGALGRVTHVLAEAYGAVVTKPKGATWRTQRSQGGGCLYDYAAHPINLVNWIFGTPETVSGAALNAVFSAETDDQVYGTMRYPDGLTAQVSVDWTDMSVRKMTTRLSIWGTAGRLYSDRQEVQLFLRDDVGPLPAGYEAGWNTRYTTDMTQPVDFYLRGEEYSSQIDGWIAAIAANTVEPENNFASAVSTDRTLEMFIANDGAVEASVRPMAAAARGEAKSGLIGKLMGRR